jgi:methionyl-tRNA formyltransferase
VTKIFLAGSGTFGMTVASELALTHEVVGVVSPTVGRDGKDDRLHSWAVREGVPWRDVSALQEHLIPRGTDAIMAAHSHAFIGRRTRARADVAVGYHPSLLPLHRGRDAVKWQARLHERVVGGTVYHLTDRIDGGPIERQEMVIVPPNIDARTLWRRYLEPLGVQLLLQSANAIATGAIGYRPQNDELATWEPSMDGAPLYRPELLELTRE